MSMSLNVSSTTYNNLSVSLNVSNTTYNKNIESFPNNLKVPMVNLIDNNYKLDEQLFIIYYEKYKNNKLFSFEHLCSLISKTINMPIIRLISNFRSSNVWNVKSINDRRLTFLINYFITND